MSLVLAPEEIQKLIPQHPPFVLVDQIISYNENCIVSGFNIPAKHLLVNSDGFLTEAGVIEHFAQSVALYQGYDCYLRNTAPPVGYIGSIKNFEMFRLPSIGDDLRTTIHILQQLFGVTIVRGEVMLHGLRIAVGEMRTVVAN